MKKLLVLYLTLLSVALAGCLPQVQATTTQSPTDTAAALPSTTAARPVPTVSLFVPTESAFLPDPGCTVVTKEPTPGPTAVSIFPPVTDKDWAKGPSDAKVTIIEYSDFQ